MKTVSTIRIDRERRENKPLFELIERMAKTWKRSHADTVCEIIRRWSDAEAESNGKAKRK